jgi:hypothetical protein
MFQAKTAMRSHRNHQPHRLAVWRGRWHAMRFLLGLFAAWHLGLGSAMPAEGPGRLKAGVAKIDITPTKPVNMAGYLGRKDLSKGVHDPLGARAIAFEQDGKRLVLVSTDLGAVRGAIADNIRKAVVADCHLQPSDLFLTAIHTHGGPSLATDTTRAHANNVEYTKKLERQLTDLIKEALAHMVPVRVGFGSGSSPVGVNRREAVHDKAGKTTIKLGRNPAGPRDPEVQVLKVSKPGTGDLLSVVFAYATHSTALGQGNLQITGDIHGMAEQFIEKYLDHGVIAPAFAGASGDIDPWVRVLPKFDTDNGWIPEPVLMSTLLAEEVVQVSNGIRNSSTDCRIKTAMKTIPLPGKAWKRGPEAGKEASVPLTITAARLGDVGIVGLGAEVFN